MYYSDSADPDSYREHIRKLRSRRVDGLLVVGGTPDVSVPSLQADFGAVVYAFLRSERREDVVVVPDGHMAGRLAAEHLLSLGRRRIAHITGDRTNLAVQARLAGLVETFAAAGHGLALGAPMFGDWSRAWGYEAGRSLLASVDQVDAVFCGNDKMALGVRQALREGGYRVPEDVAIVGYDNWSRLSDDRDYSLTTIDPNLHDLGAIAVSHLLRAMAGERTPGVHGVPCTLIPGGSTGAGGLAVVPAVPAQTAADLTVV